MAKSFPDWWSVLRFAAGILHERDLISAEEFDRINRKLDALHAKFPAYPTDD